MLLGTHTWDIASPVLCPRKLKIPSLIKRTKALRSLITREAWSNSRNPKRRGRLRNLRNTPSVMTWAVSTTFKPQWDVSSYRSHWSRSWTCVPFCTQKWPGIRVSERPLACVAPWGKPDSVLASAWASLSTLWSAFCFTTMLWTSTVGQGSAAVTTNGKGI